MDQMRARAMGWAVVAMAGLLALDAVAHEGKVSVAFDEAVYGDIPGRVIAPEDWNAVNVFYLMPGENIVRGRMPITIDSYGDTVEDEDPFRIVVPQGYECKTIRLYYRWRADDQFTFAVYRAGLVDFAAQAAYQDDEIVYSTDPDFGPDADPSPVRLFRKVEQLDEIPPLDEFPADGIVLTAGEWGWQPYWGALGNRGEGAKALFAYTLQFVVTPVDEAADVQSMLETLLDDVRLIKGKKQVRAKLVAAVRLSVSAYRDGKIGAARSALRAFNETVNDFKDRRISKKLANHLLGQSRAILKELNQSG